MKIANRILSVAGVALVVATSVFARSDFDAVELGTNRPPVRTFYIPIPEDDLLTVLQTIAATDSSTGPRSPVQTYVSIAVLADGTVVYYDQWENGYDRDIANPVNLYSGSNGGGTQIWGDGDPANGCPPGFPGDVLHAGDIILLNNAVDPDNLASVIKWDAGDKIGVTKPVGVTRVGWASGSATLLAGGNEVYDTTYFGTEFVSPVGTDTEDHHEVFEYTGFSIMAANDGTVVEVDADADGSFETTEELGEGEALLVNGGVRQSARIKASKPVQVDLLTGDISDDYESRFYRLLPTSLWSSSQTTPVSTPAKSGGTPSGTVVFLYNPHDTPLSVRAMTRDGAGQGSRILSEDVAIPARSSVRLVVKDGFGARYVNDDGRPFYGIAAVDATGTKSSSGSLWWGGGGGENRTWDWGFALIPDESLTEQVVVGLGIGRDPTSSVNPSENGAPVWVCPVGNGDDPVRVYVDYDGDPDTGAAAGLDPYGNKYDKSYDLLELQNVRIYNDSKRDQTGMLVYTLEDGVRLAAAWGEDPAMATAGQPGLDMGTGIPPFPLFVTQKTSALVVDNDGDGYITPGDVLRYDIIIENMSRRPVSGFKVSDQLPTGLVYMPGTTRLVKSDGGVEAIADLPGEQPFVLSAPGGYELDYEIAPYKSCRVACDCAIDERFADTGVADIRNVAIVSNGESSLTNTVVNALRGRVGDYVWLDLDRDGVQDDGEPGVNGVIVRLLDSEGNLVIDDLGRPYETTTRASAAGRDGFYLFTGVRAGEYAVSFQLPEDYRFTPRAQGEDRSADSDANELGRTDVFQLGGGRFMLDIDAGVVSLGSISGAVYVDEDGDGAVPEGADPIARVTVELLDSDGAVLFTTTTDSNGRYVFPSLPPGDYTVRERDSGGWTSTGDSDGVNDNEVSVSLGENEYVGGCDFYDTMYGALGDHVWDDLDGDGLQGALEPGVEGVVVTLFDAGGEPVATTTTDGDGDYLFENLRPGTYTVGFTPPAGYGFTTRNAFNDPRGDSDADEDGRTGPVSISFARVDRSVDAGVRRLVPAIEVVKTAGGANDGETLVVRTSPCEVTYTYVVSNVGETALSDIVVTDDKLGEIGKVDGVLAPGASATFTKTVPVSADTTNIATATGEDPFGDTVTATDSAVVRVIPYAYLGDRVWKDLDGDGLQDDGEPGFAGVPVDLLKDGSVVGTTLTDANGFYVFGELDAGAYAVRVDLPAGYRFADKDRGDDDSLDSDADAGGLTGTIVLAEGETDRSRDVGVVPYSTGIAVVKTAGEAADGETLERLGATEVLYAYAVTNTGETPLADVVVTDDKLGVIGSVDGLLAPGATAVFTRSAVISNDTVNVATAVGTPAAGDGTPLDGFGEVSASDDAEVFVIPDDPRPDSTICELVDLGKRYNAIIFGDLVADGGDCEGALLVGGDADLSNGYSVGLAIVGDATPRAPAHEDVLVVGGDLRLGQQQLNGNAVYGGSYTGADRSWQEYGLRHVSPVTIGPDGNVPDDLSGLPIGDIKTNFLAVSGRIAAWGANGTCTTTNGNAIVLKGTDPARNVFEVPAALWNNKGWDRIVDVPAGSKVFIRVPGTEIDVEYGAIRLPEGVGNEDVLYHYPNALTVRTTGFDHNGSVLAPKADAVLSGGAIEGLAVFGGDVATSDGFEFHNYGLDVFFCPVNPEIDLVVTVDGFRDGAIALVEPGSRIVVRQTIVNRGSSWLEDIVLDAVDGDEVSVRDLAPGETAEITTEIESLTNDVTFAAAVFAVPKDAEGEYVAGFLFVEDSDIAMAAILPAEGGEGGSGTGAAPGTEPAWVPKADIGVTEMWFNHAPTIVGEDFSISVRVKNNGDADFAGGGLAVYLVDGTHAATVSVEQATNFVRALPVGTLIPGEEKVFAVNGLQAGALGGSFRVIAFADYENKTAEYSEGDNQNNLSYELSATYVDIDVTDEGVTLSWNNNWGQVYSVIGSNDLVEWADIATGIPSARDGVEEVVVDEGTGRERTVVSHPETNVFHIPFPMEEGRDFHFFRIRIDQR